MIAYNHYIEFIPALESGKKIEGAFVDVVRVKASPLDKLPEVFRFHISFYSNQGRELKLLSDREFAPAVQNQRWAFDVKDVVTFVWYSGTLEVEYISHENFTEELLEYWCMHLMLPLFFTIEETYDFLHAGAVEVEEKSILFMANSFGGKSTLTDFFLKKGHTLISDDKVGIFKKQEGFLLVPSHPHHRPYRERETLGCFFANTLTGVKTIDIIYDLERTAADAPIEIIELNGVDKFRSLRFGSEINLYFLKEKRFMFLAHMAQYVSVFKIKIPWDMNRLSEVYETICLHTKNIGCK
ncbi:hypothetical protein ACM66Z_01915 [Sulfurovum sp. ST-21]|uniref:HPr kinase n=1 Tax=Sulfurovum indicum TaxID=2779528 RepID=A0A7M1S4Z7_9BACT|nr:hypothetical protein [Sulfurovum indicum]QOR62254.1 hypothetical protein IMZ28_01905 [Sulfurovum indicum]